MERSQTPVAADGVSDMNWLEWAGPRQGAIRAAMDFLDRWQLLVSVGGPLVVRPRMELLGADELAFALSRMPARLAGLGLRNVEVDFRHVSALAPPWTPVFASLMAFARRIDVPCRVSHLWGQPREAAMLYRHNRELAELLFAPPPADPRGDVRRAG